MMDRDALIEEHMGLACYLAERMWRSIRSNRHYISREDLKASAVLGLVEAARRCKHADNFPAYARQHIQRHLSVQAWNDLGRGTRKPSKAKNKAIRNRRFERIWTISYCFEEVVSREPEPTTFDLVGERQERLAGLTLEELLEEFSFHLTPHQREAIAAKFRDGLTYRELARRRGVLPWAVCQSALSGLERLGEVYAR